jgi:hypothetical protein
MRQPWLERISFTCLALPAIWIGAVLRVGPFSPKRKSRAAFWDGIRFTLWVTSAGFLFTLLFASVQLVYAAMSFAGPLGRSVPSWLWEVLWTRDDEGWLIWYWAASIAAVFVMLYVAHRLGPVVRRLEGKCVRCGYMLRGLPESRCPECGTPFNPADLEERRGRQESAPGDRQEG